MNDLKITALTNCHIEAGAVMAPFAGWNMPVRYTSVVQEHHHVRKHAGLFDVSHMGEFIASGAEAFSFLQKMTINDVSKLNVGCGQYTAMCQPDGGVIDDLIVYKITEEKALLCVNAANIEKDFAWLQKHTVGINVDLVNQSEEWSQIAIQGPDSFACFEKATGMSVDFQYMEIRNCIWKDKKSWIARTGYTGEQGLEWYVPNDHAVSAWQALEAAGAQPTGLGARDTLRLEACYLLYGQDMDESVSALEAGLGWATKFEHDFVGRDALLKQKEAGLSRRVIAFQMEEKGVPRAGMDVYQGETKVGRVVSGSVLPTLSAFGGLLMLDRSVKINDKVCVDIRGRHVAAKVLKKPLYQAKVS